MFENKILKTEQCYSETQDNNNNSYQEPSQDFNMFPECFFCHFVVLLWRCVLFLLFGVLFFYFIFYPLYRVFVFLNAFS